MSSITIGVDENGLGPRLGPMIVTAIVARTTGPGAKIANGKPKGRLAERLGDSKKLVSFGDAALGEAWARAIAARTGQGAGALDPEELIHALAIEGKDQLRAGCPTGHIEHCWSTAGEAFGAEEKLCRQVGRDLDRLADAGVEITAAHVGIVCTRRLNDGVEAGLSRFDVDLHTMERLILAARARLSETEQPLHATCGKVGGFNTYVPRMRHLGAFARPIVESRARSEYAVDGIGTVAFVRDADEAHMLVCMSSLVGKWVREALMSRIVRYYRAANPKLPEASGYHDPVTTRFIAASRLLRKKRRIEDACFERNKLEIAPISRPKPKAAAQEQLRLLPE